MLRQMPEKGSYGSHSLRMWVNERPDGQLVVSVIRRDWSGRDQWDQRLVPSTPLVACPPAPEGVPAALWLLAHCANQLVLMVQVEAPGHSA